MKYDRIVVTGCSCAFGHELVDPEENLEPDSGLRFMRNQDYRLKNCFGGLLSQYFSADLDMMAIPGASISHMRWQIQTWLKNNLNTGKSLILAAYTTPDRESWFRANYATSEIKFDGETCKHSHTRIIEHGTDPEFKNLMREWLIHSHSPEWEIYNFEQTVLFFDGIAAMTNHDVIQFKMMPVEYPINSSNFWQPNTCWVNQLKQISPNMVTPGQHPTQQGHRQMANWLISHIQAEL